MSPDGLLVDCMPLSLSHSILDGPTHSIPHTLAHSLTHSLTQSLTHSTNESLHVSINPSFVWPRHCHFAAPICMPPTPILHPPQPPSSQPPPPPPRPSSQARATIAAVGCAFIPPGSTILTHGYSPLVIALLTAAAQRQISFSVITTGAVPVARDGRLLVGR